MTPESARVVATPEGRLGLDRYYCLGIFVINADGLKHGQKTVPPLDHGSLVL